MSLFLILIGCVHQVDVTVLGATVGPSTANLEAWDGFGKIPAATRDAAIRDAAAIDPLVGLSVATLASWADGIAPPDTFGSVSVVGGARVELPTRNDTFNPAWSALLAGVPLSADTLLRVQLSDEDLDAPDPICSVDVDAGALRRALAAKKPYTLDLSEATAGQLLTLTVQVVKAK